MSHLRESITAGREAFLRQLTKPGSYVLYLIVGGFVALVNVIKAYKARSLSDGIAAVVIWLVLVPVLGHWMFSKRSR
jgi:hypothetical protein